VSFDLRDSDWLAAFLDGELRRYDAAEARARLPVEVRGAASGDLAPAARVLVARSLRPHRAPVPANPRAAFAEAVRAHVGLVLDLALLAGPEADPGRRRIEVAAFLAAALGHDAVAIAAASAPPGPAGARAVRRALRAAGDSLAQRFFPPGDPKLGLPLYPGMVAVLRRRLARVAMGAHRTGRLDPEALARHRDYAERETILLAEAIASLAAAVAPGRRGRVVKTRQAARLGLRRPAWREARRGLGAPRPPGAIAVSAPESMRPFLLEQLLLAPLRAGWPSDSSARFVESFAAAAGLGPEALAAGQVEAAAQHGDLFQWFDALEPEEWEALADEWEAAADDLVERLGSVVSQNVAAVAREIRETGELGGLLAKAAAGRRLSGAEKEKVRSQLIDLAKAVPALAIFAAPGGMLLLPLLAKLLPFNLLPSAWEKPPSAPGGSSPAPAEGPAVPAPVRAEPTAR
jgi:hypothetical protein